jgi:hypothetical protein
MLSAEVLHTSDMLIQLIMRCYRPVPKYQTQLTQAFTCSLLMNVLPRDTPYLSETLVITGICLMDVIRLIFHNLDVSGSMVQDTWQYKHDGVLCVPAGPSCTGV